MYITNHTLFAEVYLKCAFEPRLKPVDSDSAVTVKQHDNHVVTGTENVIPQEWCNLCRVSAGWGNTSATVMANEV